MMLNAPDGHAEHTESPARGNGSAELPKGSSGLQGRICDRVQGHPVRLCESSRPRCRWSRNLDKLMHACSVSLVLPAQEYGKGEAGQGCPARDHPETLGDVHTSEVRRSCLSSGSARHVVVRAQALWTPPSRPRPSTRRYSRAQQGRSWRCAGCWCSWFPSSLPFCSPPSLLVHTSCCCCSTLLCRCRMQSLLILDHRTRLQPLQSPRR